MDDSANNLAAQGWTHTPYRPLNQPRPDDSSQSYAGEWRSHGPLRNGNTELLIPNHWVRLSAGTGISRDPTPIRSISVSAWLLREDDWSANLEFRTSGPKASDDFNLILLPSPGAPAHSRLQFPELSCGGKEPLGHFEYSYGVRLHPVPKPAGEKLARALLESPEGFRSTALEALDQLEIRARDAFAEGTLIGDWPYPVGWTSRDGDPGTQPGDGPPLTREQRQAVFDKTLAEIDSKRELVRKKFREMHAAAVAAFPLLQCLDSLARQ